MEMRRKLLLLCLLICSIMGLWACGSDPYQNLSLTVYCNDQVVADDAVINLNIKQEAVGVYSYEQVVLLVKVDDDDDETDRGITVSDGQGFVNTTTQFDPKSGITSIVVKANSYANTGNFSLKISTNEGNKERLIKFNIDLALENFTFKEDSLQVIGKGNSLSLKNVDDYIDFYPAATTQRDIKVELATLAPAGDGSVTHFVDGWLDGGNFSYLNDGKQFASIIDGTLTTYNSYDNGTGTMVKVAYPTQTISASMGSETLQQEVVVLKASFYLASEKEYIERFKVIPVIESCEQIEVFMNAQQGDSDEFAIPLSEAGYYEMVLIDPSFRENIFTSNLEYYIERELNFELSENFHVEADSTGESLPVNLVPITGENHFKVHAMKAGIYSHEFRIVHDDYPELFDQRVVVQFTVKDLPTDILINGSESVGVFTIYDYYANSKGERIDIDLNTKVGKYEYCIYTQEYEGILSVNLNTARSTENLVFANYIRDRYLLTTTVEGKAYTKFGQTDSFYLSHSFDVLPNVVLPLYIGVSINLCADSYYEAYSQSEIYEYFMNLLMNRRFYVQFQMGLRAFEFEGEDFHVDLTNDKYMTTGRPADAIPLCVLPEGQTIDSCLAKLEYDKSLINITEYKPAERNARTVIVAQCNNIRKEGTTAVRFLARNGVEGNVTVSTYMPTIYTMHTEENPVPLAITVNEKSSGYLYRISGNSTYEDFASHFDRLPMVGTSGVLGTYDSVHTLFGIVGNKIDISFQDFTYIEDIFKSYDITNKVKVSFNNDGYVTYSNGVLSLHRLVLDKDMPIIMTLKYTGGYEVLDENNKPVYQEVLVEHKVKIYIYSPLQGVSILSEKSADLYVYDSLSFFDRTAPDTSNVKTRDLSSNTIRASFSPSERNLGSAWNEEFGGYKPLTLVYTCGMLEEAVKDKNGKAVVIQSNMSGQDYPLYYKDIFEVVPAENESLIYTCQVRSRLSEDLIDWIKAYYGGISATNYKIQSFLDNYILDKDYSIVVNIFAGQFGKLSNINTITYTCCYASKINSLKLNVDDDGVYFDVRDGKQQSIIEYTIDNAECLNKEMIIIGGTTNHYTTKIEYGSGNTGKIVIDTIDNMVDGEIYSLTIIPKDNVSDYSAADGYTFYTDSLNQTIRIKIADGSKALPFEIKSTIDFKEMIEDIKRANTSLASDNSIKYYHYVLARDISLYGENLEIVDVMRNDKGTFSLSGKHTYSRNNEEVTTYNRIYSLTINRTLSTVEDHMYIGLFGQIGSNVSIENLSILNSKVMIETSQKVERAGEIYIGLVAGKLMGATLQSVSVSGSIKTQLDAPNTTLYVGGMVGLDDAVAGGVIKSRPESAIAGMVATSNNTMIEIELNGTIKEQNVGGVAGKISASSIQVLQVVSQIKSKSTAGIENIGGVVGLYAAKDRTMTGLQISPVIVIESRGSAVGNIGGIAGEFTAGTITNSKIYFTNLGDDYSQKEKIGIYVSGVENAAVGGLVGKADGTGADTRNLKYSYVRSFYNCDIQMGKYAGNIFVTDCLEAVVGGIIGSVNISTVVQSSYFDGDIMVDAAYAVLKDASGETADYYYPIAVGLMFGEIKAGNVKDSYGIGKLYYNLTTTVTDETVDPVKVTKTNEFVAVNTISGRDGIIGNTEYDGVDASILGKEYSSATINGVNFDKVYAVVNDLAHYFASGTLVVTVESMQKLIDDGVAVDTLSLFRELDYKLTTGEQDGIHTALDYQWFYNEKINLSSGHAYPILLSASGLAMYDLVPTSIGIIVNDENKNIFNISYTDDFAVRHNQMIMFVKKTAQGAYSSDYYEIMVDRSAGSEHATIKVTFNGESVDTYLVDIAIDDQIEIFLKDNNSVLELVNNRIYPRKEGVGTIEIRSYLDKTIKTTITVKVIASVDTIKMFEIVDTDRVELDDENIWANPTRSVVYIDEASNFEISACDSEGYQSTKEIGYILELLSYTETINVGTEEEPEEREIKINGSVVIDGVTYEYREGGNNTYFLEGDSILKATGVTIGYVKFKLTPYLKLGDIYHADKYTCEDGTEIEFQNPDKTGQNVYVLNKGDLDIANVYVLSIKARAISVDNTTKVAGISSMKHFDFVSTIETSNVVEEVVGGKSVYSLLEDVYIDIGLAGSKIDYVNLKRIELEGLVWTEENKGDTYYFHYMKNGTDFTLKPYVFEYELINLQVNGFTIMKTNVNPETREHTYKISLNMHVSFDKEFYRANASKYDLNVVKFNINVIPYTNLLLDAMNSNAPYGLKNPAVMDKTEVNIIPASLTDIFMNYYTRGEGLLGNTENTYPSDNESNFIVPGRDGLLKITLAEEFNNSSYVTITLDRKYAGYVKLEQMAGVIISSGSENSTEFETYQELDYVDPVETSEYFGLRLQKLTSNSSTASYFNNTYYVKVTLAEASDYSDFISDNPAYNFNPIVEIKATSYTIDASGNVKETLDEPRVKVLTITELPSIIAQVDGESIFYMGMGVKKEIDIRYKGLSNDVMISSSNDYLYVVDENDEKVANLDIDYLDNGGKYYLCLAVDAYYDSDPKYRSQLSTVTFTGEEYVWGVLETTKSELWVNPVEFEITGVRVQETLLNDETGELEMTINHGQSVILRLDFDYADIEVAIDSSNITRHKAMLDTYYSNGEVGEQFSPKQLVEYALAGTTVTVEQGGVQEYLSRGILELSKITYSGKDENLEPINEFGKVYGGIELLNDSYKSSYDPDTLDPVVEILYTLIRGVSISSDGLLRMSVPYHYNEGKVVAGPNSNGLYYDDYVEFRVIVKDNSSDTHPTPIENELDLKNYAGTTGHYILVNNITLTNWAPIPLTVDSLDGNGYVITIQSFNMESIRATSDANAGIFTTIAANTLIKNLIIDVSHMLTDETTILNNTNIVNNSTADKFVHDPSGAIDLTFITSLNFGILAGTNNGAVTNIKVVNTKEFNTKASENKYLHILTSQIDKDGNVTNSNIGGLVGVNSATGAISNSFLGINLSTLADVNVTGGTEQRSYITIVEKPDNTPYHNRYDEMRDIRVYPFIIAGSNNIAGMTATNKGIMSNSYTKGLGVYNTYSAVSNSVTAGLVGVNDNVITSCFSEGTNISEFRATGKYVGENDYRDTIEAVGNVGGLVFTNNATIENSYANVYLETQSAFIAGFVFTNNGTISNSYSTSVNRNNLAYGQFTGVLQRVVQNFGTYENCYYLVGQGEAENEKESAVPVLTEQFADSKTTSISDFWSGFSFTTQSGANEEDGIWTIREGLPKIATTLTDTNSFRILDQIEEISDDAGIIQYQRYSYIYGTKYQEGTKGNPLIIENANNFDAKIIDRGRPLGSKDYIFGAADAHDILGKITAVEYVRLVNNLDFSSITTSNMINGRYLYETIFAGKLDGNGMSMNNLHIDTDTTQLSDFGIFKQIGYDASQSSSQTVIKNINMTLSSYNSNNNSRAGVLAGTIKNATITNVKINGNGVAISATNMAGALAGLIIADKQNKVSIIDVVVENITVSAEYSSIGGEIDGYTTDESNGRYKVFNILNRENNKREKKSFNSLEYTTDRDGNITINNAGVVSYAGTIAGVLIANNLDEFNKTSNNISDYRSTTTACSIDNIVVRNNITIKTADNSGGLFGYISDNTRIKNSKFELGSGTQLIKSWNYAGGIVGENHGIIEQCFVAYADAEQEEYDATILPETTRDNGTVNLFSMSDGNFYNVAVGGIAGYSTNGAIIDSFSKASVVQPLAFIAGGLVGYAEGANFIGYSYTTGAVYSRTIMGGIVGLQVTHDESKFMEGQEYSQPISRNDNNVLHLNTVIGLNDWDTYRDNITTILYNNYKSLYFSGEGYYNFQLKLPEIGNQDVDLGLTINSENGEYSIDPTLDTDSKHELYNVDAEKLEKYNINIETVKNIVFTTYDGANKTADIDTNEDGIVSAAERDSWIAIQLANEQLIADINTYTQDDYEKALKLYYIDYYIHNIPRDYKTSHTRIFAGSVVGASYVFYNSEAGIGNEAELKIRHNGFLNSYDLTELYAAENTAKIFSSTFGIYSVEGEGTLENGDRSDTYYKETFDLALGVNEKVTLHSYKVSYLDSTIDFNDVELNFMDDSIYMDKISFKKVFTEQEYTEQMIGSFYRTEATDTSFRKTYNIFKSYDSNTDAGAFGRFNSVPGLGTEVFIEKTTTPVWEIENILPKMNDGKFVTVEYLYTNSGTQGATVEPDTEKLKAVFMSNANERTYYLVPGNATNAESAKSDDSFKYPDDTDYSFVIPVSDSQVYIQYMATIRSIFIGESIVTENGTELRPTIKFLVDSKDTGSIFNFISGAYFSNIDIVVEFANVDIDNNLTNVIRDYNDYGILANTVENVTFDNCSITINFVHAVKPSLGLGSTETYVSTNNGFIFGSVSNSTIKNTKLSVIIGANQISINNSAIENFGFVAGSMYRTKFEGNSIMIRGNTINDAVKLNIDKVADTSNIGGVIGILNNSTYTNNVILEAATIVNEQPGTYYPQSLKVSDNYINESKDGKGKYTHILTKNISSLFGYAYNSTVKISDITGGNETFKLDYTNTKTSVDAKDTVNVSAIAGASQNTKYIGIELSGYEISSLTAKALVYADAKTTNLKQFAAGIIIGNDKNSSQVGELINDSNIGNSSGIKVEANADNVLVGGLIGDADSTTKLYNAYNTADINVTNIKVGTKTQKYDDKGNATTDANGNFVYVYEYVNTYVGGLVGMASGKVMMDSVLSSGIIHIGASTTDDTVGFAMGGLIGYMSSSSDLSRFAVLNDFEFDSSFTTKLYNSYASGVVGLNMGSFSAKNGYTYSEFLFDFSSSTSKFSGVQVSTITNNRIISQDNVFYAQEFIGNNYLSDAKFSSYAMADLYGTISTYSTLSKIGMKSTLTNLKVKDSKNTTPLTANMALPVGDSLKNIAVLVMAKEKTGAITTKDGYSRFNVYEINSTNSLDDYKAVPFKVISESVTLKSIATLERYHYISGRSTETGKVVVSLNYSAGSSDTGYMVGMNQGVISNIYMSTAKDDGNGNMLALNVAMTLINDTSGLITNVYVYERTTCQSGISMANYGKIYQSATATIYIGDELEIFAIAGMNCGEINDCYSASVGYTENNTKTTDVYMVEDNEHEVTAVYPTGRKGTITNSFYYIPEILDFDNVQKGYYKKKTAEVEGTETDVSLPGSVVSCDNTETPSFVDGRDTIWTEENGHAQLIGIKDIEGAMIIHIYYETATTYSGNSHDIGNVAKFKADMTSANYIFSYKIHFYEPEEDRPDYNVIRVVKGSDLTEYIDSLVAENYTVPNKTVIAVLNNIEVSPLLLKEFSLSPNAMMVGLYHEIWDWVDKTESGTTVKKYEKVKENKVSIIDFVKGDMDHALIKCNDGVITNLTFRRLSIVMSEQWASFAPIMQNNGKINGLQLGYSAAVTEEADKIGIKVSAPMTQIVGGLINVNDGYVYNTTLNSLNIQALNKYATFIISNNAGLAKLNNLKCPNIVTTSRQYTEGKVYNG